MDINTLKEAFRKLLSYTYFDKSNLRLRRSVADFAKSLSKQENENHTFGQLCEIANGERLDLLNPWLSKIELCFYPKKIKSSEQQTDAHFITNIPTGNAVTEKLLILSYFPVELMILDTAWLLEYGPAIERTFVPNSYGNRMDLTSSGSKARSGNTIFKKYIHQYRNWWKKGLNEANKQLKEGKNISIINFDIKNFYHSIDFDFDNFLSDFVGQNPNSDIRNNPLTNVVQRIYESYWNLIAKSNVQPFSGKDKGKRALPLSLLSAHVLANWHIAPLDDYLFENYHNIQYYGRYVDDCMIVIPDDSNTQNVITHINEVFPGLIIEDGEDKVLGFAKNAETAALNRLSNFRLQSEKIYIYHFDCQLSQESIERFENEQKERSSEFRFLTDDADSENGKELELVTLINAFDVQEDKSRRFGILEENKYKLSVFFAKLNQRLAKYGDQYEHIAEVDKIFKYFHGHLLIKHYTLWEKIFTSFVLSGKTNYIDEFYNKIFQEIDLLDSDEQIFHEDKEVGLRNIRQSLLSHLNESYLMAMSLHKQESSIGTIYLDTFMVRSYFNQFPLQEFTNDYIKDGVRLPMKKLKYNDSKLKYRWMPYYVKYYDIVCALMIGQEFSPQIYEEAYEIYTSLNRNRQSKNELKFMQNGKNKDECEFNTNYNEVVPPPDKLTISVVEMALDDKSLGNTIDLFGTIDYNKISLMRTILDKITDVANTDIFIMPELALPMYELHEFCQYSAKHSKAFISGMEYVVKNKNVYNYIVTCLPIILYGQYDAVPIIRLKNYYAPNEYKLIENDKKLKIPKTDKKWKILYHWNGHVFTNLYCFELTNIKDRAYFLGMIDAMYCPVLNRDTPYFNNIAESCARDLHCYFIMNNTSQYGDSRVTQPTSSTIMNIMKVKGGNTDDNKAIVLSAQLDIKKLREFQKMHLEDQHDAETFKFTPPAFEKSYVDKRQRRFLLTTNDTNSEKYWEDFIADLNLPHMQPLC